MTIEGKKCSTCGEWKELSNYDWQKHRQQHKAQCMACRRQTQSINQVKSRRSRIGTLKAMLYKAKNRAKDQGVPFNLTIEDLESLIVEYCPITLQPLDWTKEFVENGRCHDNSPSLDKNIPEFGYVKSNCAIISHRGNTIKSNGTLEEHRRIVKYMAEQQLRDLEF